MHLNIFIVAGIAISLICLITVFSMTKRTNETTEAPEPVCEPEPMPPGFWDSRCAVCAHDPGCHARSTRGGCVECPVERRCIEYVPRPKPPAPESTK